MGITVAIDAMGGDHGLEVTVPACLAVLEEDLELELILVGPSDRIEAEVSRHDTARSRRLSIHHASQTVGMDEPPALALRNKKDSSMRVAINLVKEGTAHACVSAGNTGALMATARFVLKTLPGIARPAIIATLPSLRGHVHMLDLGANVDSPPELLLQFAVMGSILVKYVEGKPNPSVALLNIGVEDIKGNDVIKQAAALIRRSNLNFVGFVEGDAIYTGDVDLIVCDGFDGNVALKTSEGLAQLISKLVRDEFHRNFYTKLAGFMALPVMKGFRRRIDHRRYNGATFVGLNGTVVKSHGGADVFAFRYAILEAITEVKKQVPRHIRDELTEMIEAKAQ